MASPEIWLYADPRSSAHAALEVALNMAVLQHAPLRILGVLEGGTDLLAHSALGERLAKLFRDDQQERLRELHAHADRALGADRVSSELLHGEVGWHTLVAHAVAFPPAMIVVPAEGNAEDEAPGSSARHLMRKSPVTVCCVPHGAARAAKRILVAIDIESHQEDGESTSRQLLSLASTLCARTDVEIHVVHAWQLRGEEVIEARLGRELAQPILERSRDDARHALESLVKSSLPAYAVTLHCHRGEPGDVVTAIVERLGIDVVLLGSGSRRLPGFLIGRSAETLLARLRCTSVVVKPAGFVSPVPPRDASDPQQRRFARGPDLQSQEE